MNAASTAPRGAQEAARPATRPASPSAPGETTVHFFTPVLSPQLTQVPYTALEIMTKDWAEDRQYPLTPASPAKEQACRRLLVQQTTDVVTSTINLGLTKPLPMRSLLPKLQAALQQLPDARFRLLEMFRQIHLPVFFLGTEMSPEITWRWIRRSMVPPQAELGFAPQPLNLYSPVTLTTWPSSPRPTAPPRPQATIHRSPQTYQQTRLTLQQNPVTSEWIASETELSPQTTSTPASFQAASSDPTNTWPTTDNPDELHFPPVQPAETMPSLRQAYSINTVQTDHGPMQQVTSQQQAGSTTHPQATWQVVDHKIDLSEVGPRLQDRVLASPAVASYATNAPTSASHPSQLIYSVTEPTRASDTPTHLYI